MMYRIELGIIVISMIGIIPTLVLTADTSKQIKDNCETCRSIADAFKEGLVKTKKSNFGGGNTNWEESRLGTFATSETRLVEIMDNICASSSSERKCHSMVEHHEEKIEKWWFDEFAKNPDEADLGKWLCQDELKYCCPEKHYGPDCTPCKGGIERTCKDNGDCDGAGTRGGTGNCKCNTGYKGELCDECRDSYFEEEKNETHTVCTACHISCSGGCTGSGADKCGECRSGYLMSDEHVCEDVDECSSDPCESGKYCSNTVGSYVCMACDESCDSCLGSGNDKCIKCKKGYNMDGMKCKDIDECTTDEYHCPDPNSECVNQKGGYKCQCKRGFEFINDNCYPKGKGKKKSKKKKKTEEKKVKIEEKKVVTDDDDDFDNIITPPDDAPPPPPIMPLPTFGRKEEL